MTATATALQTWLSQFGWPVYGENDVPTDAQLPYITVPVKEPAWDQKCPLPVKLWAYTKENAALLAKADAVVAAVGVGVRIPFAGGLVVLWPDTPQTQIMTQGNVRCAYLMFNMNSYHVPGV